MTAYELEKKWRELAIMQEQVADAYSFRHDETGVEIHAAAQARAEVYNQCANDISALTY